MRLAEHALAYLAKGYSVIPLRVGDKRPAISWSEYQKRKPTEDEVKGWWAQWPDANIALVTGAVSGLWVLDVDVKGGAKGGESLAELERKHGPLPATLSAETWSGGRHYYFRFSEPVGNKTGVMPGLDVRGDGGYIVAPPSAVSGKTYRWLNDAPMSEAPSWLTTLVKAHKSIPETDLSDASKITVNRNAGLFSIAFRLRKAGLSQDDILATIAKTNRERCVPPLDNDEVERIARSAGNYSASSINGPYTDVWNAALMRELFGPDLRYCAQLGGWHVWDGTVWAKDEAGQVMRLAKQTARRMFTMGEAARDDKLFTHAKHSESKSKLDAMIKLAESEDGIPAPASAFDADGRALNCADGTLRLPDKLDEHRREDMLTRKVAHKWNPDAKCPRWLQFLNEIFQGDKELISFVQRAAGYSITGETSEHCMFICYGTGRNGKSTFLKTIWRIMGPYAAVTPASTLMERYDGNSNNASQELAKLKGIRFVMASEGEKGQKLAEAQIKSMTGGEPISARFLYSKPFEYVPEFKIWLSTNYKPNISGTDQGIWSRIKLIPFNAYFGPDKMDKNLDEKLMTEAEGILVWLAKGAQQWYNEGLGMPAVMREVLDEYREKSDLVGAFINECCERESSADELACKLSGAAQAWAKENGYKGISRNQLSEYLEKLGIAKKRATSGLYVDKYVWSGVRLKADMQPKQYGGWYDN